MDGTHAVRLKVLDGTEDRQVIVVESDGAVTGWHGLLFRLSVSPCLMPAHRCSSCPASAYATVQTNYRDRAALVQALRDIGYAEVETHEGEGAHLRGYQDDERPERAHVIVRRQHVGQAANDLGFVRAADGTYQVIVSAFDSGRNFGAERQKQLKRRYARNVLVGEARRNGWGVSEETLADGRIKLTVRR